MNKRVLSMLTAGVMAASTLLSSVPTFAAGYKYLMINIPYEVFYKGQELGNTIQVDALSCATQKLTRGTLGKGAYGDTNYNIEGVTIPVRVSTSYMSYLDSAKEVSSESDLLLAGDYAYYELDTKLEPGVDVCDKLTYSSNGWELAGVDVDTTVVSVDATLEDGANSHHTTYAISLDKAHQSLFSNMTIYGAYLFDGQGGFYGLKHISGIWRNLEFGFDENSFSGITGKSLTGIGVLTDQGWYELDFTTSLPIKATSDAAFTMGIEDANTITIDGDLPEGIENATAKVYYYLPLEEGQRHPSSATLAEGLEIKDGKIVLPTALTEGETYYVVITSDNYVAVAPTNNGVQYGETEPTDPEKPTTPKKDTAEEYKHEHNYEWVIVDRGTATKDGVMRYQCTTCGDVEYSVPIAAYYVFNKDTQQAIKKAAANATVKVETPIFISFHEMVKEALVERPDVTLVVDYKNAGKSYEMTIPAGSGATLTTLFGQDKFAGFLYLGGAFATVEK